MKTGRCTLGILLRTHSNSRPWVVRLRHPATIPSIRSKLSSKDSSKHLRTPETTKDLIERAYWALTMNVIEPVNQEEIYDQEDVEELVNELLEFING